MDAPGYTGGMDISVLKTVIIERELAQGFYSRACFQDN